MLMAGWGGARMRACPDRTVLRNACNSGVTLATLRHRRLIGRPSGPKTELFFFGRSAAMSEFLSASRLCAWIAVLIWDLDCQSAVRMSCSCERSCRISPFRS